PPRRPPRRSRREGSASLLSSFRHARTRTGLGHGDDDRAVLLRQVFLRDTLHVGGGDLLVVGGPRVDQVRVVVEQRVLTELNRAGQRTGQRRGLLPDGLVVRLLDFPVRDRPVLHLFELFVERRFNVGW